MTVGSSRGIPGDDTFLWEGKNGANCCCWYGLLVNEEDVDRVVEMAETGGVWL